MKKKLKVNSNNEMFVPDELRGKNVAKSNPLQTQNSKEVAQ